MRLTLIDGTFSAVEARELFTRMVQVKFRFLEERIGTDCSEEDLAMREKSISLIQQELARWLNYMPYWMGSNVV